ncbi:MAG: tripartite tricarboxylate transporter substrate binding protein [Betaproteobacteria bacterium]|nr:tripartite tricarboxylate transporter substrate binding protein [Betaproteobacteria bacterium]
MLNRRALSLVPVRLFSSACSHAFALVIALLINLSLSSPASAQTAGKPAPHWPSKSLKIVVVAAPGGLLDTLSRLLADRLAKSLGQQVIVESRAGGAGNIGAEYVARSAPDGYTLLTTGFSHSINPTLLPNPGFDYEKDLAAVSGLTDQAALIAAHPSLPVGNVQELIALARQKPGQISFGASFVGSPGHIAGELINYMAKVQLVYIAYKGAGPALNDNIGGQINITILAASSTMPHVTSGRLKALAVTSAKRSNIAPGVPTVAESGLPGYEVGNSAYLLTTGRTPADIVERLSAEVRKAMALPDMREALAKQGVEPWTTTPAELEAYIKAETLKWAPILRSAGIKAQ